MYRLVRGGMADDTRIRRGSEGRLTRIALWAFAASIAVNLYWVGKPDLWTIPAMLFAWFLADMLSGAVHMFMDYRACVPNIGLDRLYFYEGSRESPEYAALFRETMGKVNVFERLVYDFKNHHPRPMALGRRTLQRQVGLIVVAGALPLSIALNILCALRPVPDSFVMGMITFLLGSTFAQYFHGSLHREDNPWIINVLRRLHLLMTPEAHVLHHETLQRDFSTNNGWSNPLLNAIFRALRRNGRMRDDGLEPG